MTNWAEYEQVDKIADSFNRGYEKAKAKFLQSLEQVKPLGEEEVLNIPRKTKGLCPIVDTMGVKIVWAVAQASHQNVIDQIKGMME